MKNHFGRLLLVLLIVALSTIAFVKKPPPLGLDLKGGASLTYQATASDGELTTDRMTRAISVIEGRLNSTGVAEISITPTQSGEIVVELPGRTPEQITDLKALIERNGQLEFRIVANATDQRTYRELWEKGKVKPPPEFAWVPQKEGGQDLLVRTPERPLKLALDRTLKKLGEASPEYKAASERYDAAAADDKVTPSQRQELRDARDAILKKLESESPDAKAARQKYEEAALAEVFTGDQLVRTAIQRQTMQIVVAFEFKEERKPWFGQFTEKHVNEQMAIILDGKVNSAPNIKSKLPGEGVIEGGGATGFTDKEANELAIVLESGSTGIKLTLSREESLGPSLGELAIERGVWSVVVGFLLVVALMFVYYRMPGMVANVALLLNVVILIGVMAFMRAAITLPGIAGIVLTLGMAVDANILIFERYREERHRGKSTTEALAAGYDRALSAIIDTHATTILTAVVLIWLGTGSVKGFGVSLTVGLIASFFTAYFVTRWIFEWALEKGLAKDLVLGPDKRTPALDFMGKRKWFTGPSFVLMILGVVAYIARDDYDKRDLEFVGGQEAIVQLSAAITPAEADRRVKADKRYEDASIVTLAATSDVNAPGGQTNRFRIRSKAADQREGEEFMSYLASAFDDVLVAQPYSGMSAERLKPSGLRASFQLHTVTEAGDPEALKAALLSQGLRDPEVKKDAASPRTLAITVTDPDAAASVETLKTRVGLAVKAVDPPVELSDPFPSKSFLEASRAEDLYRSAMLAMLVSMAIQVVYIRLRYANFNYGVAAVIALAHDVPVALGAVMVCDHLHLVYAKVNLVLIAAFLTLIGYSMNDTIVVFDRIREDLGRGKVVRSALVNKAVNETLARSIRTSLTVFVVVLVQFAFSYGTGSVLEGFAFVMVVGVLAGAYSSIFIAAPLLLFLPHYAKKFTARPAVTTAMVVLTIVGTLVALESPSGSAMLWISVLCAFNIPIHFLVHFFPWLGHKDPDDFVQEEIEKERDERPLAKPGI